MTSKPITKSFNSPEKLSLNPHISETDIVQSPIHQDPKENLMTPSKENPMNYPSFSQYINPQRLKPYDEMLKKNIRSFNIIPKGDKKFEENFVKNMKEIYSLDTPTIEINFKFTCDYELIESEMKEFLEIFGEINSLNYDMNANSLKINYKYYFASMYANYYLNHLIYENKRKNKYGNYLILTNNDEEKCDNKENKKKDVSLNEKQSEDILKFIKFLTENYKNEPKMKQHETPVKNTEDKFEDNDNEKILEESMEKKEEENCDDNCMENSSKEKNEINSERKNYSNIINNPKNLDLLQNSETPVKKSNIFNNYSANNIFSNNKNSLSSKGGSNFSAAPLNPFNTTSKPPFFYMPFVPKMNMKLGIPIPILFPIDPSFLRRQISENKKKRNSHKEDKKEHNNPSQMESKHEENKINSCLMYNTNNNPINLVNDKQEIENFKIQNDNQLKEIFDNINNQIANISNHSNDSTNTNEKNNNIENVSNNDNVDSNNKSKSSVDSSNKIMSNKSDSTIKTENCNKSNTNTTDEINRAIDVKTLKDENNKSSSGEKEKKSKNSSSSGYSFMSSFKGKTLSLERLNNYLQENKPVSNFENPQLSLNLESQKDNMTMNNGEEKNENEKTNKENSKEKENTSNPKNNYSKSNNVLPNLNEMNNYFNSMYNYLCFPTPMSSDSYKNPNYNGMPYPPIPFPYPSPYQLFKNNPINFSKDVIDFNKLTLETKNKVHFNTHSSRNYYYKYVCNYTVQIENDDLFMVTKRIIGKNGCFLKKILQESCIKYGDYSTKIRLRGKGSGYVDKVSNSENTEEPLMLSVSSLNYPTYYNCCLLVDNLMNKIYDDYYDHLHKVLPKELHYSIIKKKIFKNEFIVDRVNSMPFNNFVKNDNMDVTNRNFNNTKKGKNDKKEENKDKEDKDSSK